VPLFVPFSLNVTVLPVMLLAPAVSLADKVVVPPYGPEAGLTKRLVGALILLAAYKRAFAIRRPPLVEAFQKSERTVLDGG
jgi:hypothetical protein